MALEFARHVRHLVVKQIGAKEDFRSLCLLEISKRLAQGSTICPFGTPWLCFRIKYCGSEL